MSTIYVKKDGSGEALTIQQGIQLAQLGDTVEVEAGIFDENIDLWKGIILKGSGINQTIITGTLRSAVTARPFVFVSGQTTLSLTQAAIDSGITTTDYEVGRIVTASGIPTNARIVSKTPTSITISAAVTSSAATRTIAVVLQNEGSIRVRGTNGVIRDLKVVGFDHPSSPGVEYSSLYFRAAALGSAAANGWEIFNCEFEANGEYAILADSNSTIGNIDIHDCIVSGKTFVGQYPAVGNQFTVWNVPRQLVTLQSPNFGIVFRDNIITGVTGGLTITGVPSYNTAVTVDAVGAIISGNTINTESGTGYALRARGLNADVSGNVVLGDSAGFYVLPNHSINVPILVGTMLLNSSRYWVCIQDHTSSASNSPLGAEGSNYWREITIGQVNASGIYGVGLSIIGSNNSNRVQEIRKSRRFYEFMNHRIFLTLDKLNGLDDFCPVVRTSDSEPVFYYLSKNYHDTVYAALGGSIPYIYAEEEVAMTDDYVGQNLFKVVSYISGIPRVPQGLSDVIMNGRGQDYLKIKIINTKGYSSDGEVIGRRVLGYLMVKEQFEELLSAYNSL
jgi:hypothetical protein